MELIDRQTLFESIRQNTSAVSAEYVRGFNFVAKKIVDAPTIDAVPVVRCKDCKHLLRDNECPLRTWFVHVEDDFCSYGERREP